MVKVVGFNHVSILVENADKSLEFYQELLGLKTIDRPNLGFAGYWLDLGSGQTIHIMELENPYKNITKPIHGGRDAHFALQVDCIKECIVVLDAQKIKYTASKSGRKALFLWDIDNNVIELFEKN